MSATPCLHLPIDFERRQSVRLFARALSNSFPQSSLSVKSVEAVTCYALRIWFDWAVARVEWRPLHRRHEAETPARSNEAVVVIWNKEDLTYVIEAAAGWMGTAGDLMIAAVDSKFFQLVERDDKLGLILDGFWDLNQHLSPDFKSIQSRGGIALAEKRYKLEATELALDRKKVFDAQGILPFGDQTPTDLEQQLCYALFFRLHRCCNLDVPAGNQFAPETMVDALNVIRKYTQEEIAMVENYLVENRENPAVVKVPAMILKNFPQYVDPVRWNTSPTSITRG